MARMSKDQSTWRVGGLLKRDANATKAPDSPAPHRSSKDTKRWCRGKVGVPHSTEWKPLDDLKRFDFYKNREVLVCKVCGKNLDYRHTPSAGPI